MTREDIQAVIDRLPELGIFGLKPDDEEGRAELLDRAEDCKKICQCLTQIERTKNPNPDAGSHFLKHVVEQEIGYIENGAFIAAAIHSGFEYRRYKDSPNVYFNMGRKSIKQTRAYKKRYRRR